MGLTERERLSREVHAVHENARQAKTVFHLEAKKIPKLGEAIDEERPAHAAAEEELADLSVELATLAERAAQADERRAPIERLPPGGPT
jgi:hypothetical protein